MVEGEEGKLIFVSNDWWGGGCFILLQVDLVWGFYQFEVRFVFNDLHLVGWKLDRFLIWDILMNWIQVVGAMLALLRNSWDSRLSITSSGSVWWSCTPLSDDHARLHRLRMVFVVEIGLPWWRRQHPRIVHQNWRTLLVNIEPLVDWGEWLIDMLCVLLVALQYLAKCWKLVWQPHVLIFLILFWVAYSYNSSNWCIW